MKKNLYYLTLAGMMSLSFDGFLNASTFEADCAHNTYRAALAVLNENEGFLKEQTRLRESIRSACSSHYSRIFETESNLRKQQEMLAILNNPRAVQLAVFDNIVQPTPELVRLCLLKKTEGQTHETVEALLYQEDQRREEDLKMWGGQIFGRPTRPESAFLHLSLDDAGEVYAAQQIWLKDRRYDGPTVKNTIIDRYKKQLENAIKQAESQIESDRKQSSHSPAVPSPSPEEVARLEKIKRLDEVKTVKTTFQTLANTLNAYSPNEDAIVNARNAVQALLRTKLSADMQRLINTHWLAK